MIGAGITNLMHQRVAARIVPPPSATWVTLPGVPASVRAARRFVRDALADSPPGR